MDLSELIRFGQVADQLQRHWVAEGGFIVPSRRSSGDQTRQKEHGDAHVGQGAGSAEAGPAARSRSGRRAPTTGEGETGASAHPVEWGLSAVLELEELFEYNGDARWIGRSSSSALLTVPVGLFESMPYRAVLVLEVPRARPPWFEGVPIAYVPFVRAWAWWSDGIAVRAHHEYPDWSICACTEVDWRLGVHTLQDYVAFCVCWIAKVLHRQLLARWPGVQHLPAGARVRHNQPDEFCGCGRTQRYKNCCMPEDVASSRGRLELESLLGRGAYLLELERRGLSPRPPFRY